MGTKNSLNKFVSNGFLLMAIIFAVILYYVSIRAQKIANNWQSVNDQAYFEAKLKTLN